MSGANDIQLRELKDTILQLNKTISTQNTLILSLQKSIDESNARVSEKDQVIGIKSREDKRTHRRNLWFVAVVLRRLF